MSNSDVGYKDVRKHLNQMKLSETSVVTPHTYHRYVAPNGLDERIVLTTSRTLYTRFPTWPKASELTSPHQRKLLFGLASQEPSCPQGYEMTDTCPKTWTGPDGGDKECGFKPYEFSGDKSYSPPPGTDTVYNWAAHGGSAGAPYCICEEFIGDKDKFAYDGSSLTQILKLPHPQATVVGGCLPKCTLTANQCN